ncbi:MAG: hypothetical protein NWF04_05895 [Candidatus Bathyarchaeota archaeon]|nr:hypothetical protein [Candidatus Bathyarchaeota archaeon]
MHTKSAITKLQAILLIDLIIVAAAAGAYFYIDSLPGPALTSNEVQLTDLQVPSTVLTGQPVRVSANVTNLLSEDGTYLMSLALDGVADYATKEISLNAGETKTVEFELASASAGLHVVKIGNLETSFTTLSTYTLADLAVNRTQANAGEPIGITVKVVSQSQETVDYSVTLQINGAEVETKTGQVAPNAQVTVLFEVVEQTEGTYTFSVGNLDGTFMITTQAAPAKPAEFEVSNLEVNPGVTESGVPVDISVDVTNVGETSGTYDVELLVDNAAASTQTVTLAGGETTTVTFTLSKNTKGTYNIKIDDQTSTLTVQEPSQIVTTMFVRPYEVYGGETVTATITARNPDSQDSSLSLRFEVDGELIDTKTVHVSGGGEETVEFTVAAPSLEAGDSKQHLVKVNSHSGGFLVVKDGYHTMGIAITPNGDADFTLVLPDGTVEEHKTFYSALMPEGTYSVTMPYQDPTGRVTFLQWDDGSTDLTRTFTLDKRLTVTATYTGGTSCPSLYIWNGTTYIYLAEVSNHGWLGYTRYVNSDGSLEYWRNNPWDYIPVDRTQVQEVDGYYLANLTQRWDEIFFVDAANIVVVDHPADQAVYSTMVEQYIDPDYMGQIYTVSKNPQKPVSAFNEQVTVYNGEVVSSTAQEDALDAIWEIDGVHTSGFNGKYSEDWNNQTWNRLTLDLGNLTGAEQIKLVVTSMVDWGPEESYTLWMDKFYSTQVPDHTQPTPTPFMEVKDANGNWIGVSEDRQFPLPPDGVTRTFVVDLTDLFPTEDYSLRISNFWNVTFDCIGVDTTIQQNTTIQTLSPTGYLYQEFEPVNSLSSGNFTRYGNVTDLLLTEDDKFVIGKQGDAIAIQFPTDNLDELAPGMERDYFFFVACWFKVQYANYGFGPGNDGFTVEPLPFHYMSGFPYPLNTETYPFDEDHLTYLREYNTRIVLPPE